MEPLWRENGWDISKSNPFSSQGRELVPHSVLCFGLKMVLRPIIVTWTIQGHFISSWPLMSQALQGFLNYRDLDIGAKHPSNSTNFVQSVIYASKLFKESLERLVIVKITVDPSNFFSYEQSIPTQNWSVLFISRLNNTINFLAICFVYLWFRQTFTFFFFFVNTISIF